MLQGLCSAINIKSWEEDRKKCKKRDNEVSTVPIFFRFLFFTPVEQPHTMIYPPPPKKTFVALQKTAYLVVLDASLDPPHVRKGAKSRDHHLWIQLDESFPSICNIGSNTGSEAWSESGIRELLLTSGRKKRPNVGKRGGDETVAQISGDTEKRRFLNCRAKKSQLI